MEASRSRSPIWTVSPPRSAGSIAVRRSTVDPAIASTRVRIAAVSSLVSGRGGGDRGHDDPVVRVQLALVLVAHPLQVADPASLDDQAHEPERTRADPALEQLPRPPPRRWAERDGRAVDDRLDLGPREHVGSEREVVAPAVELAVAQGDLEGRLRVAAGGRGRRPSVAPSAGGPAGGRIGEEVGHELALAIAGHRLADHATGGREGEVGDLSPELGDGTLALRVDLDWSRVRAAGRSRRGWRRCPVLGPRPRPSGRGRGSRWPRDGPP